MPAGDMAPPQHFLAAMGRAVTGVTLVTTAGPAGRFGITVSAISSVCADPPMLLACLNERSPACAAVAGNGCFAVNILAAHHDHLADVFAGRPLHGRPFDFAAADWLDGAFGVPLLDGALASFACAVAQRQTAGTHSIFIGRVLACDAAEGTPLLYANRRYGRPAATEALCR
jgi:flavin reductase